MHIARYKPYVKTNACVFFPYSVWTVVVSSHNEYLRGTGEWLKCKDYLIEKLLVHGPFTLGLVGSLV